MRKYKFIYQKPVRNRKTKSIHRFTEKLLTTDKHSDRPSEVRSTLCRPQVSDRKPHMCELNISPKKPIELPKLCCALVKPSSHLAMGSTNAMLSASMFTDISDNPQTKSKKIWYRPTPMASKTSSTVGCRPRSLRSGIIAKRSKSGKIFK